MIDEKFKKLNITNVLELSLIAPIKYEDYTLKTTLMPNSFMVVDATIEHIQKTQKTLQLKLFSH